MSLAALFIESSRRYPERPALEVEEQTYSYASLRKQAESIAAVINQQAQATGHASSLVAVLGYRSLTAYTGILGTLLSGRGYVPLHPEHPGRRTATMIEEAGVAQLLVGSECFDALAEVLAMRSRPLTVIAPDTMVPEVLQATYPHHRFVGPGDVSTASSLRREPGSDDSTLAYLMFTSGSTGVPKGVPITHRKVQTYVRTIVERYGVVPEDRFSQTFDLTFDPSVHDMFVCWSQGACLCPVPASDRMAPARFIQRKQLTMWASVPSVGVFLQKMRMLRPDSFPTLRRSMFCGEPLTASLAEAWQAAAPNSVVENLYGPTEATITITGYEWKRERSADECLNGYVPMGYVFDSHRGIIVDADLHEVPDGEAGELCLSGEQIAGRYWNNPAQTAERFVRLPEADDVLWYRTGDLVKRDEQGLLHYLGRIDHQVKVRGQRIELLEVDQALRQAAGTDLAVAVAWPVHDGSADGIVGFVEGPAKRTEAEMLTACRAQLPPYAVPRSVKVVETLPMNLNGKIDRGVLVQKLEDETKQVTKHA